MIGDLVAILSMTGVLAGLVFWWLSEEKWVGFLVVVLMAGLCYIAFTNPYLVKSMKDRQDKRDAVEAECRTPYRVSSVDNLELWAYKRTCGDREPIYFSKSGTSQKLCHTSHVGKITTTTCNTRYVPNAEE